MTKSLGRTYSLLDFSGREMHYWPGNLPRRRAVPRRRGITRHIVRAVLSRVTPACSRVSRGRNAPPPSSPLIFSLRHPPPDSSLPAPPLPPLPPAVEPLRLHCIVLEGTPGETSPHVRKVTARPLFPQTAVVAVRGHEHEKF